MKDILSNLRKLLGIEMLEYEDKNLLSGDNKTRSVEKMLLLEECINLINQMNTK